MVGEVSRSRDFAHHRAPVTDAKLHGWTGRSISTQCRLQHGSGHRSHPSLQKPNWGETDAFQPRREKTDHMVHMLSGFLLLDQKFRGLMASFQVSHHFPMVALFPQQRTGEEKQTPVNHYNSLSGITIGNYKLAFQQRIRGYLD